MIDICVVDQGETVVLRPLTELGEKWARGQLAKNTAIGAGDYRIAVRNFPMVLNGLIATGLRVEFE